MNEEQKLAARTGMEYNSQREALSVAEYGRHVQKMIDHAKTIEDAETRQFFMEMVVELMGQVIPNAKPSPELTNKLWNHAFMIANYEIDVTPPEDVTIVEHTGPVVPPKLPYPSTNKKFRHYGVNVQRLVDKAVEIEDAEKKQEFANAIGSYMKLAYKTWNPEHYVNDEVIKGDLGAMADEKLDLENVSLDFLSAQPTPKQQHRKRGGKRGSNNKNRSNRQRRRR